MLPIFNTYTSIDKSFDQRYSKFLIPLHKNIINIIIVIIRLVSKNWVKVKI